MKKVRVKSNYRNDPLGLVFQQGSTVEIDDTLWAFLQNDSPDSFAEVKPRKKKEEAEAKEIKQPTRNKRVSSPKKSK